MTRKILDTSVLISYWHQRGVGFLRKSDKRRIAACALSLTRIHKTNAIVTPVRVEFLCGVQSAAELILALDFLKHFEVVDDGRVLQEDWHDATRIAQRVPRNRKRRHLGDCLIRALANRYALEVKSVDAEFPR